MTNPDRAGFLGAQETQEDSNAIDDLFSSAPPAVSTPRVSSVSPSVPTLGIEDLYGERKGRSTANKEGFFATLFKGKKSVEDELSRLHATIRSNIEVGTVVGFISIKSGVGQTSDLVAVAEKIAEIRKGQKIVAATLDHHGTLSDRIEDVTALSSNPTKVSSMARVAEDTSITETTNSRLDRHFLRTENGLHVLGSTHKTGHPPITEEQFNIAIGHLKAYSNLVLLDLADLPDTQVYEVALKSLDALVVVTSNEPDSILETVNSISEFNQWSTKLTRSTVVVLNRRTPVESDLDLEVVRGALATENNFPVRLFPWDKEISRGQAIHPTELDKKTDRMATRIAADIVSRVSGVIR